MCLCTKMKRILYDMAYLTLISLTQADMVVTLFQYQRQFLASSCSDTSASGGSGLMQAEEIKRIQNMATMQVRRFLVSMIHCMVFR